MALSYALTPFYRVCYQKSSWTAPGSVGSKPIVSRHTRIQDALDKASHRGSALRRWWNIGLLSYLTIALSASSVGIIPINAHISTAILDTQMTLQLSHISAVAREPSSSVSHTTVQEMIAITTTATPSVMHNTSITKRPKLSLQTAALPATFVNSNTGLVARSCVTSSPTIRNTFSNAYDIRQTLSAIDSPSSGRSAGGSARHGSPFPFSSHRSDCMPYQQPLGVRSILRNSPLKKVTLRRSVSISASGMADNRRMFFPARKQVSFRNQLEEEIKTVRFVARHSDIDSDDEQELLSDREEVSGSESSDSSDSQSDHSSSGEDDENAHDRPTRRMKRKSAPSERQVRAAALRDGLDNDRITAALSAVPSSTRQKRRCKWRWTLGNSPSTESDLGLNMNSSTRSTSTVPPVMSELSKGNDSIVL